MSWIKLDDQIFTHPKVVDLSKDAKLLYLAGLCYCGAQLTDGLITNGATRILLATIEANCEAIASLVDAGLWETNEAGGYRVHDYLEHQSSRDEVLAVRDARARAGQAGGVKSGATRRAKKAANEAIASPLVEAKTKQKQIQNTDTELESIEIAPASVDIAPVAITTNGATRDMQSTGQAHKPKPAKQTALPADYPLTDEMRVWARMEVPDLADRIDTEHKKFCNHYRSKGERRADWRPAWETWMIRAVEEFAPTQQKGTSNGRAYESPAERREREWAAALGSIGSASPYQSQPEQEFAALPERAADARIISLNGRRVG